MAADAAVSRAVSVFLRAELGDHWADCRGEGVEVCWRDAAASEMGSAGGEFRVRACLVLLYGAAVRGGFCEGWGVVV